MSLPPPPVPPDADLRDYPYLPLHVQRLRDSSLAARASDAEFKAWMILICVAWHQIPAGSLPTDDRHLAYLAGFGRDVEAWQKLGPMKLHGWHEHADGRLYCGPLAEQVRAALATQKRRKDRTRAATEARTEQGEGEAPVSEKKAVRKPPEWPGDALWLKTFILEDESVPFERKDLLDFEWWERVSEAINGIPSEDRLRSYFGTMAAWLLENPGRGPRPGVGTQRFVRNWLTKEYDRERRQK